MGFIGPIIRIPSLKVGDLPSPKKRDGLDHGTHGNGLMGDTNRLEWMGFPASHSLVFQGVNYEKLPR